MQQHDDIKEVAFRLMWNGHNMSTADVFLENSISMEFSNDVCIGVQGWLTCHASELCIEPLVFG
jgi:hypothetical protein